MSIDTAMQDFQTDINRPPIEMKIKYDPASKSLRSLTDGKNYIKGTVYVYESPMLSRDLINSTTPAYIKGNLDLNALVSEFETSITKNIKIWESIPTIEDYFDLNAINNIDEVESAFYEASVQFGW
ncbi:MAG: hypothetical protein QM484_07290 [Woeseiaceae bacterium]